MSRKRKGARASAFAAALAHAGLGVTLMGVAGTTAWRSEALTVVGPGETMNVGPYTLALRWRDAGARVPTISPTAPHVALMDGGTRGDRAACPSSASIPPKART